ncbi:uncharacterized protein LOC141691237 [Apium graveolens]|uniref:uncharacterized protein LOC141691237 n=1 Tax=Apium graveolens TaxID=4045 RepID=UPI003D7A9C48
MGDFNDLLFMSGKKGGNRHPQWLINGFRKVLEECQVSELVLNGRKFTWEHGRGTNKWVREKLDRAFATDGWWEKFPLHNLQMLHVPVLYHEPLKLDFLKIDISNKKFRFYFENIWLKEPGFIQEVTDIWHIIPVTHIIPKLNEVTTFMEKWERSFFHKFREKLKVHKLNMENLVDREDASGVKNTLMNETR